ncbi:MAG: oligoendopeptidase F [Oscillospiraceae bacterium]|nr:oligoendopeptidase F [Oscillospiraceae bacterium]
MQIKNRNQVEALYTWNLKDIYENEKAFEEEYKSAEADIEKIPTFRDTMMKSADDLKTALDFYYSVALKVERLYIYAMLYKSEDNGNPKAQSLEGRAVNIYVALNSKSAFIEPLILSDTEKLTEFIEATELKSYKRMLSELLRRSKHILSEREEEILAKLSDAASTPKNAFEMLESVDMTFPDTLGENGENVPLSHGMYGVLVKSKNRDVRKAVFENYFGEFNKYINTFAATYSGSVKTDAFFASVKNYESSLEAGLFSAGVPTEVYKNLISSVRKSLPIMEKYISLRKKALGLSELEMFDLYPPIVKTKEQKLSYSEAKTLVLEALKPLGERYSELLNRAFSERWIDVYENKGKTTGAFSCGMYGVHPFVLLNYTNTLDDAFTVAHELGHAMHSYLSDEAQEYHNSDYTIMAAEVASTVNEVLLTLYLLKTETDKAKRAWVLNHFLESFRATVFRQTLFAEFELRVHEQQESGEPITAESLNKLYKEINEEYYKGVKVSDLYSIEWARIPHFYNAFYVYQYATGFSAAVSIAKRIVETGDTKGYLEFLKTGGSDFPIEELKLAGVDLSKPETIENAMKLFDETIEELKNLL